MSEKRGIGVKFIGLSEIFILVFAVGAFGFFMGEVKGVDAQILPRDPPWLEDFGFNLFGGGGTPLAKQGVTNVPNDGGSSVFDNFLTENGGDDRTLADLIFGQIGGGSGRETGEPDAEGGDGKGPIGLFNGILGLFGLEGGTTSGLLGHLGQGLFYAGLVAGAIQLVGGIAGLESGQVNALSLAAFGGIMAGKFTYGLVAESGSPIWGEVLTAGEFAGIIGVGVGVAILIATYKETSTQTITYECLPWEPPLGGDNCELCNDNELQPCSEYRCKALGQACDLVNKGSEDEKCVWINPGDVTAPSITPWEEPLTDGHRYVNHNTLPPSLGTRIVREPDACIRAFTPLQFGITTDEPAQCKIDISNIEGTGEEVFDNMAYYFGDSFYRYNHTEKLNLPDGNSLEDSLNGTDAPEIPFDGIYNFNVRCRDANGNFNIQQFVFQICVDPSPDTTPPVIEDTSIQSGSYVAFDNDNIDFEVYVNEPAECSWDLDDKAYEEMANGMSCDNEIYEINAQQLYRCSTTLTGIVNREDNEFYFRCKDQPRKPDSERNVNTQSYEVVLKGSQPLDILEVGPNETIFGSTGTVEVDLEVKTGNGAEEGDAICYFSDSGEEGSYVAMFETESFEHKQTLQLTEGEYTYYFRCVDAGGNSDEDSTVFNVEVDQGPPMITRAYRELDGMKVVTNEDAECVYSLNSCNYVFDEGLKMIYSNPSVRTNHFAEWNPGLTYYIKCRDDYGNEPAPSACSLIASASNVN